MGSPFDWLLGSPRGCMDGIQVDVSAQSQQVGISFHHLRSIAALE